MTRRAEFLSSALRAHRQRSDSGADRAGDAPTANDADLAARIRRGDRAAFSAMVRKYYDGLCTFIASLLGCAHDAEEIAQDLLFHLWEQRATWELRGSIKAYLYSAARNRALNRIRRRRLEATWERSATHGGRPSGAGQRPGQADEPLVLGELSHRCRLAVAALPPRSREIYRLQREHHLTYAEIASALGIAEKTVEVQMGLALKALRRHLADWLVR